MHRTILVALGALSLAGCATSSAHESTATQSAMQPAAAQPGMDGSEMSAMCPFTIPGTTVREQDVEGGGALVFTTTSPGDVKELRQRVANMADMHNQHVARHHQMGQGMGGAGPGPMEVPNAQARVEDVEGGARIVYTPADPAQVPALREQLVRHASQMASGNCPMMKMHQHEREMERQGQP